MSPTGLIRVFAANCLGLMVGCSSLTSQLEERARHSPPSAADATARPQSEPSKTTAAAKEESEGMGRPAPSSAPANVPAPSEPLEPIAESPKKPSEPTPPPPIRVSNKPSDGPKEVQEPRLHSSLGAVGRKLADNYPASGIRFEFESLYNPRPKIHHTADGHIYVSEGLLRALNDENELAALLAMEMARAIREKAPAAEPPPASGPDDSRTPSERADERKARDILSRAGYDELYVLKLRDKRYSMEVDEHQSLSKQDLKKSLAN